MLYTGAKAERVLKPTVITCWVMPEQGSSELLSHL